MRRAIRWLATAGLPGLLLGEGLPPRASPADYPVHAVVGDLTAAAENHYRTATRGRDTLFLREGLVVEVAVYGPERREVAVSPGQFSLRVNGKGALLLPEPPGVVLSRDRWGHNPALVAQVNDMGVILGGPEASERFPGDPRRRRPPGDIPRVESPSRPPDAASAPLDLLESAALPFGGRKLPVAGLLYFHYSGKTKKIKKLELYYQATPGKSAVLRLK